MYQIMTKIKSLKNGRTMYIYPYKRYAIGDIIGYMWEEWKVIDILTK